MVSPDDFPLPELAANLKILRGPDQDGEPSWTLYHPVSHNYYKIGWAGFECLSRFSVHRTALSLKNAVEEETSLKVTLDEIWELCGFLRKNGLVALKDQPPAALRPQTPWWKSVFHRYLYFSMPLVRPEKTLKKIYPYISFLFSRWFVLGMMAFLVLMIVGTLPRLDEFLHTFRNVFSVEGVAGILLTFAIVKIVHECAHAFAAVRHGVPVPHMGVAFIVLYPVLYTETTGSWRLKSRRARFDIAIAGIVAELCLAAISLALWHILPSGSFGQTLCFLVAAVSLAGSLLVNLNPLMRFDGYYMFSDATGIDNLQSRSLAFARWRLREVLFGLGDPAPEDAPPARKRILQLFGAALLVYRFFLFTGIALLVYHLFFQPLGAILMLLELGYFIVLPVLSELGVWWKRRADILSRRRSLVPAAFTAAALLFILFPWQGTINLPAVLHASESRTFYAPGPAYIDSISVEDGNLVAQGATLAVLSSPELNLRLDQARTALRKIELLRRRSQTSLQEDASEKASEAALEKARLEVSALQQEKDRLVIKAPFAGVIRDLSPEIQPRRSISSLEPLFRLVNPLRAGISAYATEEQNERLLKAGAASFLPSNELAGRYEVRVSGIAPLGVSTLSWPELASLHGGPIAAEKDQAGAIVTRRSLYEVKASLSDSAGHTGLVQTGYLRVKTERESLFSRWLRNAGAIFRRESGP